MAGPQSPIDVARAAGYSDDDTVAHLGASDPRVGVALKAGYTPTEILNQLGGTPAVSGVLASGQQGFSDVLGGAGATLHDYLGPGYVGDHLTAAAKATAPANFNPAQIIDDSGSFHPGNIPAWLAQRAPGVAAQLVAARVGGKFTGGSTAGKIVGAGGAGTLMSAGNEAQTAMDNQPGNTPGQAPNADALTRGAATAFGENAVSALPLARFVPGSVGTKIIPGLAGALDAAKRFSVNAGLNAAGSGASDVVHQVGQSVGTPGGTNVNLPEVADATAGGGVMGGALGSTGAARDLFNAKKYSAVTPELMPAMRAVANRAVEAAGGRNMDAGILTGSKAQATGADVYQKVATGVHSELADAVSNLTTPRSPEASNIIKSTTAGRMPTEADYNTLKTALGNDPHAAPVLDLIQQAHALQIVKDTGHLSDKTFSGGLASSIGAKLTGENIGKTAMVAAGGAALEGGAGHLIAYSPEILAATAGLTGLARLSDNLTGARSPMGRFTRGFADDGATPVRSLAAPAAAPAAPDPVAMLKELANRAKVQKQRADYAAQRQGQAQADEAVRNSPFIEQKVGGAENVPDPVTAKAMKQAIGSANALAKLQSDPEAEALQARADKAAAKAAAVPTKAPSITPPPNVTSVSKGNGKVNVGTDAGDGYKMPFSPYAGMSLADGAQAALTAALNSGVKVNSQGGFLTGFKRNVGNIRAMAADVAARVPGGGISKEAIAGQFEGVDNLKDAIAHREKLKQLFPQAAPLFDRYFSDRALTRDVQNPQGIWKP